jgi:hypothetical protein
VRNTRCGRIGHLRAGWRGTAPQKNQKFENQLRFGGTILGPADCPPYSARVRAYSFGDREPALYRDLPADLDDCVRW